MLSFVRDNARSVRKGGRTGDENSGIGGREGRGEEKMLGWDDGNPKKCVSESIRVCPMFVSLVTMYGCPFCYSLSPTHRQLLGISHPNVFPLSARVALQHKLEAVRTIAIANPLNAIVEM